MSFSVVEYLPYIKSTVLKFTGARNHPHYEDLVQEGVIALMEAYRSYKEDSKVSFITYSRKALYGALSNYMRRQKIVIKKDSHGNVMLTPIKTMSFEGITQETWDDPLSPVQKVLSEKLCIESQDDNGFLESIKDIESKLDKEQLDVFCSLFLEEESQVSIAKRYGVTPQAIQSRVKTILKKLRGDE